MATLHQMVTHPEYVEGCFGCKVGTQRVGYCGNGGQDATAQKKWDAELNAYDAARRAGIQPDATNRRQINQAVAWSDRTGIAYSEEAKQAYNKRKALERFAA